MLCHLLVPKCHICGRTSNYSEMIDNITFILCILGVKRKRKMLIILPNQNYYEYEKVLHTCPICKTSDKDF
jgi:heme oxygenase